MDIIEKLKDGICGINVTISRDEIPLEIGLLEQGIIDSFGFIELIGFIEETFNIEVGEDEITEEFFGNLIATKTYIENKTK